MIKEIVQAPSKSFSLGRSLIMLVQDVCFLARAGVFARTEGAHSKLAACRAVSRLMEPVEIGFIVAGLSLYCMVVSERACTNQFLMVII